VRRMRQGWIAQSGQAWKLYVFYALLGSGLVLFVAFLLAVNDVLAGSVPLAVGFVTTTLGALAWLGLSVKCRACGERVAWTILRTQSAGQWLTTMTALENCPRCGSC
jgi:hypothetical protein